MLTVDRVLGVPWVFERLRAIVDGGQLANLRLFMARIIHDSVLDIGCGTGALSRMTDARYLGVDAVPGFVEYARRKYGSPRRRFLAADALAFDPADLGQFDVVSFLNLVHHLPDGDVRNLVARLMAVRPKYFFLVDVAHEKAHPLTWMFERMDRGRHFRTREAQAELLESCGLKVEWKALYWSSSRIYPHSVLLASVPGGGAG